MIPGSKYLLASSFPQDIREKTMGFTVEDMMTVSKDRYSMELIAGKNGWANSISWLLMLEDITITHNFSGKELAVTTGLGFDNTEALLQLARQLVKVHASGLIINTGRYILEIPEALIRYCDSNDLPLLTVPWDVVLADMIKDLSIRIFLQGDTDEQISSAFIQAIEEPDARDHYSRRLLQHFDIDGTFQVILISAEGLDKMDTVDRRRLGYRMQLYLSNITHNGHFFYYDSAFVLIVNAVDEEGVADIVSRFRYNLHKRMPEGQIMIGVSDTVLDISRLYIAHSRARAALAMSKDTGSGLTWFSGMGMYRLLYLITDRELLDQMSRDPLAPLLEYDRQHNANYVDTLEEYLRCDGSIQAVAKAMFTHRNTVTYRMNNIRRLLGSSLDTPDEKMIYQIACLIRHMYR